MPPSKRDIVIQIAQEFDGFDVRPRKIEELVNAVCKRFDLASATVSIAIIDDEKFCELNSRFRNSSFSSDCLSFDLSEDGETQFELVVNGELASSQAGLRNHSVEAELALYITHGLLHNLGFDDATAGQAKKMHKTEDEILQQLGYGLVYNTEISTEQPNGRTDA